MREPEIIAPRFFVCLTEKQRKTPRGTSASYAATKGGEIGDEMLPKLIDARTRLLHIGAAQKLYELLVANLKQSSETDAIA